MEQERVEGGLIGLHGREGDANRLAEARAGFVEIMPLWLGAAPFGMIYAVSALAAGLSAAQTQAMSLLVFAGASQFTAAGLFAAGVAPLTIVITTLIVNARHLLLAASLAPHLRRSSGWMRLLLGLQLTDESYATGIRRFATGGGSAAYQLGANVSLYVAWQLSTLVGIIVGSRIPDPAAYGLDLIFPLTFLAMLMPLLKSRANVLVAALGGLLAVVAALLLPGSWYILLAGLVASALGAAWQPKGEGEQAKGEGDQAKGEGEKAKA
jgi:4-azaleucine resistance transporter AzlC